VLDTYETSRLKLVASKPSLVQQVNDYYRANRDFLAAFEPEKKDGFFTPETQRRLLIEDSIAAEIRSGFRFWLIPKDEPETIIGTIALTSIIWGAFQSCFMGYKLDKNHLNRGYMTETVRKCVRIGFDEIGLHRIEANIMPRNKPSLRVAEKAGFIREGLSKEYMKINGVWEDHLHMVKLNHGMRP
jgi:[ribosomal protein S5]-alanine N-acetyltransferase